MSIQKLLGVAALFVVWIAVFLFTVLPVVLPMLASVIGGVGLEVPNWFPRSTLLLILFHPWVTLIIGSLLLILLGWAIFRLLKT